MPDPILQTRFDAAVDRAATAATKIPADGSRRRWGTITAFNDGEHPTFTVDIGDGQTIPASYLETGVTLQIGDYVMMENVRGDMVIYGRVARGTPDTVTGSYVMWLTLGAGTLPEGGDTFRNRVSAEPFDMEILGVSATTGLTGAPAGGDIVIDLVHEAGSTSLFSSTTPPTILEGDIATLTEVAPDTTVVDAGTSFRVQVTSTGAAPDEGDDVLVAIRWRWAHGVDGGHLAFMALPTPDLATGIVPQRFRSFVHDVNILGVSASTGFSAGPGTTDVVFDLVDSAGVSLMWPTLTANRPTIVAGTTETSEATPEVELLSGGTSIRTKVVSIGTAPDFGSFATLQVRWDWSSGDFGNLMQLFLADGDIVVGTYEPRIMLLPRSWEILGMTVYCGFGEGPTGADAIFDLVDDAGVSLWPTTTKPTITAGTEATGASFVPDSPIVGAGQAIRGKVVQRGSTVHGADAVMLIRWQWSAA